jgi:hypothetical protein
LGKFELSLGSFTLKIGRDSATTKKGIVLNNSLTPNYSTFEWIGGQLVIKDNKKNGGTLYAQCPPLNYILNSKTQLHNNGVIKLVNPSTLIEPKIKVQRFEEYERLLRFPNPLQTEHQFRAQVTTTMQVYPFCVVLKIVPIGFNVPSQLWALPSQFLKIERNDRMLFTDNIQDMIKSVKFCYGRTETTLNKEDLYFFTSPNASFDDMFAPQPVLEAIKPHCVNIINILESRANIIQHQGARGLLTNVAKDNISPLPLDENQKNELHKDWSNHGLLDNQKRIIITSAALQWQQIGMPFNELQLLEQYKDDVMGICGGLNYKFQLLPHGTETAFNNQNKAYAAQYRDCTIPEANNYIRQYNDCVNASMNGVLHIVDYTETLNELVDRKEESEIRKNNTQSLLIQFTNCFIKYDEAVIELGNKEINPTFKGKYFNELTPDEQKLFLNGSNQTRSRTAQANDTNEATDQGDQGQEGQSDQGQENN